MTPEVRSGAPVVPPLAINVFGLVQDGCLLDRPMITSDQTTEKIKQLLNKEGQNPQFKDWKRFRTEFNTQRKKHTISCSVSISIIKAFASDNAFGRFYGHQEFAQDDESMFLGVSRDFLHTKYGLKGVLVDLKAFCSWMTAQGHDGPIPKLITLLVPDDDSCDIGVLRSLTARLEVCSTYGLRNLEDQIVAQVGGEDVYQRLFTLAHKNTEMTIRTAIERERSARDQRVAKYTDWPYKEDFMNLSGELQTANPLEAQLPESFLKFITPYNVMRSLFCNRQLVPDSLLILGREFADGDWKDWEDVAEAILHRVWHEVGSEEGTLEVQKLLTDFKRIEKPSESKCERYYKEKEKISDEDWPKERTRLRLEEVIEDYPILSVVLGLVIAAFEPVKSQLLGQELERLSYPLHEQRQAWGYHTEKNNYCVVEVGKDPDTCQLYVQHQKDFLVRTANVKGRCLVEGEGATRTAPMFGMTPVQVKQEVVSSRNLNQLLRDGAVSPHAEGSTSPIFTEGRPQPTRGLRVSQGSPPEVGWLSFSDEPNEPDVSRTLKSDVNELAREFKKKVKIKAVASKKGERPATDRGRQKVKKNPDGSERRTSSQPISLKRRLVHGSSPLTRNLDESGLEFPSESSPKAKEKRWSSCSSDESPVLRPRPMSSIVATDNHFAVITTVLRLFPPMKSGDRWRAQMRVGDARPFGRVEKFLPELHDVYEILSRFVSSANKKN